MKNQKFHCCRFFQKWFFYYFSSNFGETNSFWPFWRGVGDTSDPRVTTLTTTGKGRRERSRQAFPMGKKVLKNHGNPKNLSVPGEKSRIRPVGSIWWILKHDFPIGKACRERSRRSLTTGIKFFKEAEIY